MFPPPVLSADYASPLELHVQLPNTGLVAFNLHPSQDADSQAHRGLIPQSLPPV